MADQKISELTALTGANVADDDAIAIVDTSATETKKIVFSELKNALDTATGFVRITGDTMTGDLNVLANVGIGTSSPSANLEIAQSGNNVGLLVSGGGYNYTAKFESSDAEANIIIEDSNSTNDGNRIGVATNDMYFITNTSEAMRIDSGGNVGIGTSSPSAPLTVQTSATTNVDIKTSATNGTAQLRFSNDARTYSLGIDNNDSFFVYDATGTSTRMTINSSGNVGIGTTSPFDVFHVRVGTDKNLYFTDASSETGNVATIQGINNAGSSLASVGFRGTDIRFANQSSETMRIDNSGKVGIGTSSPTGKLSIASGTYNAATPLATADDIVISGNQSLGMSFITASAGSSNQTIVFGDSDNTDIGMIRYAHANNSMQFTTNTTEAMRIDSSGRVGIGTTSPSGYRLHVEAVSGGNGLKITRGAGSQFNIFQSVDGISHVGSSGSNAALTFRTGTTVGSDTERMRIDSSGNVGIGTSSPSYAIDTLSSGAIVAQFKRDAAGGASGGIRFGNNDKQFTLYGDSSNGLSIYDGATERMRIDSSGNVGVGVTPDGSDWNASSTLLHLYQNSTNGALLKLESSNTSVIVAAGNNQFQIGTIEAKPFQFYTSGSERMRIDSSGNLLVGKTSADDGGTSGIEAQAGGSLYIAKNATNLHLNRLSTDGNLLEFYKNGATVGSIGTIGGFTVIGSGDTGILFDATEDAVKPRNSSTASRDAAIDLGGSGDRFKNLYLSGGVYLGGTGSANKLDDYEEGTWTPTIYQGITSPTFSQQHGFYRKVGSLVYADFYLQFSGGTGTNALINISGLPFNQPSGFYRGGGCSSFADIISETLQFYGNAGTDRFAVYHSGGSNLSLSTSVASKYIIGTFIYISA